MTTSIDAPGCNWDNGLERINTPPKTNMDTQNDRLESPLGSEPACGGGVTVGRRCELSHVTSYTYWETD